MSLQCDAFTEEAKSRGNGGSVIQLGEGCVVVLDEVYLCLGGVFFR